MAAGLLVTVDAGAFHSMNYSFASSGDWPSSQLRWLIVAIYSAVTLFIPSYVPASVSLCETPSTTFLPRYG